MSLAMWQSRAIERSTALDIDQSTLLRSADIITGALGSEWLEKQERLAERHERIISDVHPLYREITSSSDGAIVTVCELAKYLQEFASDAAILTVLNDLRADKYESTLLELALAHRWSKAGAAITLQPPVPTGTADFAAIINGTRFVVEASTFPADVFSQRGFRAATIVTKAAESVINNRLPVAVKVVIREYIDGDFEGQLRHGVREVCRSLLAALKEGTAPNSFSQNFSFCSVNVEEITDETELIVDSSGAPWPLQASNWDLCVSITARRKAPGSFSYMVLNGPEGRESVRLFMKLPRPDQDALNARIAKKLRKEARQLRGLSGPRVVILDASALASDGLNMNMDNLSAEMLRLMRNTPELVGVWLLSRVLTAHKRHQYSGHYIPNSESIYELPGVFVGRLTDQEGTWDFVNDKLIQSTGSTACCAGGKAFGRLEEMLTRGHPILNETTDANDINEVVMESDAVDLLTEIRENIERLETDPPSRVDSANLSFTARIPFKAEWYRVALRWRFSELCRSSFDELEKETFVSAIVLTRAAVETFASLWYLCAKITGATEPGAVRQVNDYLTRAICGHKNDEAMPEAINVLNCIDKVNDSLEGFREQYDQLCEYAHPNWAGTVGMFSKPDHENRWADFGSNVRRTGHARLKVLITLSVALKGFILCYEKTAALMPGFTELCERDLEIRATDARAPD